MLTIKKLHAGYGKVQVLHGISIEVPKGILVAEVFRIIGRLKSEGVAMLLVEQFVAAALAVADYRYVLENGRISVHGPAAKLRDDPAVKAAYRGGVAGLDVDEK